MSAASSFFFHWKISMSSSNVGQVSIALKKKINARHLLLLIVSTGSNNSLEFDIEGRRFNLQVT